MPRARLVVLVAWLASAGAVAPLGAAPLQVTPTAPLRHSLALPTTPVVVDFDKPVNPASVGPPTVRVFGRGTERKTGTFTFSNGERRVTFQPAEPFTAGEGVRVLLSHDLAAADLTTLRAGGFFLQFRIRAVPSGVFQP